MFIQKETLLTMLAAGFASAVLGAALSFGLAASQFSIHAGIDIECGDPKQAPAQTQQSLAGDSEDPYAGLPPIYGTDS